MYAPAARKSSQSKAGSLVKVGFAFALFASASYARLVAAPRGFSGELLRHDKGYGNHLVDIAREDPCDVDEHCHFVLNSTGLHAKYMPLAELAALPSPHHKRDGCDGTQGACTNFNVATNRILTGTRSVAYDFDHNNYACTNTYCSGGEGINGNTLLTGNINSDDGSIVTTGDSCGVGQYGYVKVNVIGQFRNADALNNVKQAMTAFLYKSQAVAEQTLGYPGDCSFPGPGGCCESSTETVFSIPQSLNINNYDDNNIMNFMTVSADVEVSANEGCGLTKDMVGDVAGLIPFQPAGILGALFGLFCDARRL